MESKYDHILYEQKNQDLWRNEKIYTIGTNSNPLYSIDTPPPTVSGSLHIGHIFSYTQTDIIARFKRMSGFAVFYPFGFDDNGLPTERFVEKKRGISAHQMKRSEFIDLCLQETEVVEKKFEHLWQKIGLSVDWDICYSTISAKVRKISQESFLSLYAKKYIYRKYEPALYCTTCRTSVAQAELDDIEKPSFFNTIAFHLDNGQELLIGTTRPELLGSCVALLYHPSDQRYNTLNGRTARVPLFNFDVPLIADELVQPEKGTGLVMCCTFGDKTDIAWYKRYQLPFRQSIGLDGKFSTLSGPLAGLKVTAAREKIVQLLQDAKVLKEQKTITHSVNVHERCKNEIEYVPLSQWFLNLLDHKEELIACADKIEWYPSFMKTRYINWVKNLNWDWCISRQRFFGIPFPVWHCQTCNFIIVATSEQLPLDPQEVAYDKKCPQCQHATIIGDSDVMDTWNTSSLTPYICLSEFNKKNSDIFETTKVDSFLPMGMRPQAHDIIRTWAFYTIAKTWMHHSIIPWKEIVISGHVLSDNKEKLSKSKENAKTDPENLLKNYPADVIRYWTASGTLGHDMAFSETQLRIGQKLITKLWNACRFIREHTLFVSLEEKPKKLGHVNEWILDRMTHAYNHYQKQLTSHEFNSALDAIEKFFWQEFCDTYLELIKDQLFKPERYTPEIIDATRWTLAHLGIRIIQLYAPYLPYITETLYQELYRQRIGKISIHQSYFKNHQSENRYTLSVSIIETLISAIKEVRTLKTAHHLSLKTEINTLTLYSERPEVLKYLQSEEHMLQGITHAHIICYQLGINQEEPIVIHDNSIKTMSLQLA